MKPYQLAFMARVESLDNGAHTVTSTAVNATEPKRAGFASYEAAERYILSECRKCLRTQRRILDPKKGRK